jgi:Xaa-Pro aminopeptidase
MRRENILMVANSVSNANMLYAVGVFVREPFVYFRVRGKCWVAAGDQDIDCVRRQVRHCRVISLSRCHRQIRQEGVETPGWAHLIRYLLRRRGVKKVAVPEDFPLGLAQDLRRLKIMVKAIAGDFFPEREIKSAEEVKKISAALMMAEVGLAEGIQLLESAKIGKRGQLLYRDLPLTAERLRAVIEVAVLQAGGHAHQTIVAAGRQSSNPDELGHGRLMAHQPIILSICPRSQKTGYFGDITRTVVKGRASEPVRRLYATVLEGQKLAFRTLEPKVPAHTVHRAVQGYFEKEGYRTGNQQGRLRGFFHSTGHGVGLELHETPKLSANSPSLLRPGQVVTIQPGLYYPEIGGVRLEDMAFITASRPRNLTQFEKVLEI